MKPLPEQLARLKAYYEAKLFGQAELHAVREKVQKGRGEFVLLDARSRDAFLAGHIPGALSAPLDRAAVVARLLPADREYVTYSWGHA